MQYIICVSKGSILIRRQIQQAKCYDVLQIIPEILSLLLAEIIFLYIKVSFNAYFKGGFGWT